jgi:hypothetical protein
LIEIPEQDNTAQRGYLVAAQFSIKTITETEFCSQTFHDVLSFHLTEILQQGTI